MLLLPIQLLAVVVAVAAYLAFRKPLYYLLLFDLALLKYVGHWDVGGIRFDPNDVITGFLVLGVFLRDRSVLRANKPYFVLWVVLGIFMSLSYLLYPDNARNLTGPVRIGYQLYRYCWKPILYYPICLALLADPAKVRHALVASIVGADACAWMAIRQGYSGEEPTGPFNALNAMGGFLIIPLVAAVSGMLFPASKWLRLFYAASALALARALLFSASRGAMAAAAGGFALYCGFLFLIPVGRKRIFQMIPLMILGVAGLFVARPDVLDRPAIRHVMTTAEGTQSQTMQWRLQDRWPHFFAMALEKPWVGQGTAVDTSLSDKAANTPHNGYLTLAVKNGFVVAGLYVFFIYRLFVDGLRVFRRSRETEARIFAAMVMGACAGLAAHNMLDATIVLPLLAKIFWMLCAANASNARSLARGSARSRTEDTVSSDTVGSAPGFAAGLSTGRAAS